MGMRVMIWMDKRADTVMNGLDWNVGWIHGVCGVLVLILLNSNLRMDGRSSGKGREGRKQLLLGLLLQHYSGTENVLTSNEGREWRLISHIPNPIYLYLIFVYLLVFLCPLPE
jgi:hypothetical protein